MMRVKTFWLTNVEKNPVFIGYLIASASAQLAMLCVIKKSISLLL